jgi:lambda repressor-like predicted transcriptional regulator
MTNNKDLAINESRRRDLERFIVSRGIKVARWARQAGISEGTIRNFLMKRSSTLTQATVDALVAAIGVPPAVIFPSAERAQGQETASRITFMSRSRGALDAKDLPVAPPAGKRTRRFTERPEYLKRAKDAFALRIDDSSMSPAFERGWLAYVDPAGRAKAGDNVVVELADGRVLVRRLVRKTRTRVVLRQYSPKKDVEVKAADLDALYAIAGVRYRK